MVFVGLVDCSFVARQGPHPWMALDLTLAPWLALGLALAWPWLALSLALNILCFYLFSSYFDTI